MKKDPKKSKRKNPANNLVSYLIAFVGDIQKLISKKEIQTRLENLSNEDLNELIQQLDYFNRLVLFKTEFVDMRNI